MKGEQDVVSQMDNVAQELIRVIVDDYKRMKQQFNHPALSQKLSSEELWGKYGKDYVRDRENPEVWKMTIDQMGEREAVEFSRRMEKAMMEVGNGGV